MEAVEVNDGKETFSKSKILSTGEVNRENPEHKTNNMMESDSSISSLEEFYAKAKIPSSETTLKQMTDEERKSLKEEKRRQKLEAKRIAEEKESQIRKEKALKGMRYLLGLSEKYSTFFKEKIINADISKAEKNHILTEKNRLQPTINDIQQSDLSKLKPRNTTDDFKKYADVGKYLKYFEGGTLRPYQLDGVTWMTVLYENGLSGILADEMGLGKTIQVIALICHLYERQAKGPYLIVAPLSTIPNWASEFKKFAPKIPVVVFHGNKEERSNAFKLINKKYSLDDVKIAPVVITSYSVPLLDTSLNKFVYQYIVVDEAQRIKNYKAQLSVHLRKLQSKNRLLLTGTPLQNNITELWALLNFLLPHIFNNLETFNAHFALEEIQDNEKLIKEEEKTNIISTIHKVLAPFMLRRLKIDVVDLVPKKEVLIYCPLTETQKNLYKYVLEKNITALSLKKPDDILPTHDFDQPRKKRKCALKTSNLTKFFYNDSDEDDSDFEKKLLKDQEETGVVLEKETAKVIMNVKMSNAMMMYRKIVNHPYLVHFPLDPENKGKLLIDENLIRTSGKMMVLDLMLEKLKRGHHKVLIFSTLFMVLDLIEECMTMRNYEYRRLDGSYSLEERTKSIEEFNNNDNILAFLITTKAGGLGLNLTAADTVIFFDRDWNPQVDIQAQDRCHRIGQTKPVVVYTLVTKNTIDQRIIELGSQKRRLERLVINDGKFKTMNIEEAKQDLVELKKLLKKGDSSCDFQFSSEELDKIMDRSDLYK